MLPLVMALLVTVVAVGMVSVQVLQLHALASGLARHAAVAHDRSVRQAAPTGVEVHIEPASGLRHNGDPVRVHVSTRLRLPWPADGTVRVGADATALTELPP